MTTTYQQREEQYQHAPADVQYLYASEDAGVLLRTVFESYQLRSELYYDYAMIFGDVVLGFEDESRMPQLLVERVGLPEKLATLIAHDLLEFINEHKSSAAKTAQPQPPATEPVVRPTTSATIPSASPQTAPAWRQTDESPRVTQSDTVPRFIPNAPTTAIPSYRKPLTDTPQYKSDPYRESP